MKATSLLMALTAAATTLTTQAIGFTDTFDSIDAAWLEDRYNPAGFNSVMFNGDNRLEIQISANDSAANRPLSYSSAFYNTQGRQRAADVGGTWSLSGDLYISDDMLAGGQYRTDLWAKSAADQYPIIGVIRDGGAPIWRVWDSTIGAWITVGNVTSSGWHNLEVLGGPGSFSFYLDGALVHTDVTTQPPEAITTAFVQAYNFGADYSVYWDNISVSAVPEAGATLALMGVGAMALAGLSRRRK